MRNSIELAAVERLPAVILLLASFFLLSGCGRGPQMAPVQGKVLYRGEPLKFGSVMLQPDSGQPARGQIQSDGSFVLSTYREGDGAAIGKHRIRVACYEGQRDPIDEPSDLERPLGKSLIPRKYTQFATSELTFEVRGVNAPLVIDLQDPASPEGASLKADSNAP